MDSDQKWSPLAFQQKVDDVLLLDAISIEADQRVSGKHNFLILIVYSLERVKFTICSIFSQYVAHLGVQSLVSFAATKSTSEEPCFPMYMVHPLRSNSRNTTFSNTPPISFSR